MGAAGFRSKDGTSRGWRWRRCRACQTVEHAGAFTAERYGPSWQLGDVPRRCPNCGYVAATWRFQIVRERHP
jgi:hypothetical protein